MSVDKKISFFHGESSKIGTQIAAGVITPSDFVVGSDDDILYYIDENSNSHALGNPKTKKIHSVQLGNDSLGSFGTGDVIGAGADLDVILDRLLTKRVLPTYAAPQVVLQSAASSVVEAGTTVSPTLSADFFQNDAGSLTEIGIYQEGVTNSVVSSPVSPLSAEANFVATDEGTTFFARATFKQGPTKTDNLGQEAADGRISAGEVTSAKLSFVGKRRAFWGAGTGTLPEFTSSFVRSLPSSQLDPQDGFAFDVNVVAGQQYVVFAYPATLSDVASVTYIEMGDTSVATKFSKETINVEGAEGNSGIDYKVYHYTMAVPAATTMTFRVTI